MRTQYYRGEHPATPLRLGPKGWLEIARLFKKEIGQDHLTLIAAGVAFYTLLAVFPGIAALISLWGLIAEPAQVAGLMDEFHSFLPAEAYAILRQQAVDIAGKPEGALTFGFISGIVLTLSSASAAVKALIMGLNVVYDERERRGFVRLTLTGLGLTLFLVCTAIICLVVILAAPDLLRLFLPDFFVSVWEWARWPLLCAAMIGALSTLYRFGPCCQRPRWRWFRAGSILALALWIGASVLFSWYATSYGNYNETYGSLGAVIILLMWFWLSALAVLLGAELNAEIERRSHS